MDKNPYCKIPGGTNELVSGLRSDFINLESQAARNFPSHPIPLPRLLNNSPFGLFSP